MFNWLNTIFGFRNQFPESFYLDGTIDRAEQAIQTMPLVNPDSALGLTSVLCAITTIASQIAKLKFGVYREMTNDTLVRRKDHQIDKLLNGSPNPTIGKYTFFETLMHYALAWGNSYWEIEYNNAGVPIALWSIHPNDVTPLIIRNGVAYLDGNPFDYIAEDGLANTVAYRVVQRDGQVILPATSVFHIRGLGTELVGYSPVKAAALSLSSAMNANVFSNSWFENGCRVSGMLEAGQGLNEEGVKNLDRRIQREYAGSSKAGKVLTVPPGSKFTPVGIPAEDASFIQEKNWGLGEVARAFCIPIVYLQQLENAHYANMEQQATQLIEITLKPWLERIQDEVNRKFLAGSSYCAMFDTDLIDRADVATRSKVLVAETQAGIRTRNEARKTLGLPALPGLDEPLTALNMGNPGDQPDSAQADDKQDNQTDQPEEENGNKIQQSSAV